MTGKTFRVGLIGAGYVSQFHIAALKREPRARVVGITDLDFARAKATGLAAFPSLKKMAAEGLDVVHVLTPPSSHCAAALEAMALGCHVLVEKPMATSVEECDQLLSESQKRNLRLCVNHSMLGDPFVRSALKLIRDGAIGQLLSVDILRSSDYLPYRGGPLPPQYREGGYPFRDLGVHALYLLQEFLGDIRDVSAEFHTSNAPESDPNIHFDEWRASVVCARGNANVYLSWNVKPLQHLLLIHGTRGTLRVDLFSMFLTRRRHTPLPKAIERVANALGESAGATAQVCWNAAKFVFGQTVPYQGLHNFVHSFYNALSTGAPMPVDLNRAREVVRWVEQIARDADHAKEKFYSQYRPSNRPAVVVTGANGLLGRALVKRLIDEEEFVRLFVRRLPRPDLLHHPQIEVVLGDLGDPEAVDAALAKGTAVFHLGAAMSGGWAAHECATITGTRNVVEACVKHRVPKLIHVSSLSVVDWAGQPEGKPVTESSALEPAPQLRGYYTQAKLEAERIVRAAAEERKLPVVILRPGQIWSEGSKLITPAVGIRVGQRLIMIGDPDARLPLVHVDDVVEGIVLATRSDFADGRVLQLVDDNLPTREELAKLCEPQLDRVHLSLKLACFLAKPIEWLATLLGRPAPISPYRLRSAAASLAFDCTEAREQLGWHPQAKSALNLRQLFKS